MINIVKQDRNKPPMYDISYIGVMTTDYSKLKTLAGWALISNRKVSIVKANRDWRSKRILKKLYKAIIIYEWEAYRIKQYEIIYQKV